MTHLNITDLSLLKITKVKPWSICFEYDGVGYLLHGESELGEGSWQSLWIRELNENGKYNLKKLGCSGYATDVVVSDYIEKQKGKSIVYSQINKEFFVYMLTKRGFATGIMESRVKKVKERTASIDSQIEEHEAAISRLKEEKRNLDKWMVHTI